MINMKKRVIFPKGNQKKFMQFIKAKSNFRWNELAETLKVNESTLSKAYVFEMCNLPYELFKKATLLVKKDEKELLKKYNGKIKNEVLIIGRKVIGEQKKKLEEINVLFKNKDFNLDSSNINYSNSDINKKIKFPNKMTPELAEEIGMHYGDGFLSSKRYTYRLKGNFKDEIEYYQNYIKPLFKKLYNLDVALKRYQTTYGFEIYSQAFCEFKIKTLGIKPGNKREITIPEKIKVNDIKILTSFLRGLFDTDGSLYFKTRYGYEKYYPNITLSLFSKKLVEEVGEILKMLGFNPNIYFNKEEGIISLNGIGVFKKYEELIGWSSPKNLNKLKAWKNKYPQLNKSMVAVV